MKPEERKVVLHTFKNIKKDLDHIGGVIDSCVRDIEFYSKEDVKKKDYHKPAPGAWM